MSDPILTTAKIERVAGVRLVVEPRPDHGRRPFVERTVERTRRGRWCRWDQVDELAAEGWRPAQTQASPSRCLLLHTSED